MGELCYALEGCVLCRDKAERAIIGNCRAGEVCGRVVWGGMDKGIKVGAC
jgi:hypothetical protein